MNALKQSVINGAILWKDLCLRLKVKTKKEANEEFVKFMDDLAENPGRYDDDNITLTKDPNLRISYLGYDYENQVLTSVKDDLEFEINDVSSKDSEDLMHFVIGYLESEYCTEDDEIEHIDVDSSWIKSFDYNTETEVLTMETMSENVYTYNVSPELWEDLKDCHERGESVGSFYNEYIK